MAKRDQLTQDAETNLQPVLKNFKLGDEQFNDLGNWTYLGIFLHDAARSIALSERFNEKDKFAEMDDVILAHGMFRNFILSYAKCFSQSGSGRISLDARQVFKGQEELLAIHNRVMEIRNTFGAHNGLNDIDVSIIATEEQTDKVILAQTYTLLTPLGEFGDFKKVISHAEEWVVITFNRKVDKLQERLGKTIVFK